MSQLSDRRRQPALRRVVQRSCVSCGTSRLSRRHHTDTRICQQPGSSLDRSVSGAGLPQRFRRLPREQGGALDGDASRQNNVVARLGVLWPDKLVGCCLAQHCAADDWPVEPKRDFSVSADRNNA